VRTEKNRKRYRTVAFRMSDDELCELEKRVALSGRQKQDFLIKSILYQKIVVVGNPVQFEKLRVQLDEIVSELKRIERAEDVTSDLLAPIRTAVEIINGFHTENK
jgi:malonyl CoA-acyl carrier protein transacylase